MAKRDPPEEILLGSRRALLKWIRTTLRGECILEHVSPRPLVFKRGNDVLPKQTPRMGRLELAVRPGDRSAHESVVTRRYALRMPTPAQWIARSGFKVPHTFHAHRRLDAVWEPVGLDCGGFWFSGAELFVRELPPRIDVIEPEFDLDAYSYAFRDHAAFPGPGWWLGVALEAGFCMAPVDNRGFVISAAAIEETSLCAWRFAERNPRNLLHPLSFEVWSYPDGDFRVDAHSMWEEERAGTLKRALIAAVERLPGLRVLSGNCDFTFEEWCRKREQTAPPAVVDEVESGDDADNVVPLDLRRRS